MNLLKKVVKCPSCSQRLRVPIRPGKRLRIRCSSCQTQFDLSFQTKMNPLFFKALVVLFIISIVASLVLTFIPRDVQTDGQVDRDEVII